MREKKCSFGQHFWNGICYYFLQRETTLLASSFNVFDGSSLNDEPVFKTHFTQLALK
jgi:hypothetical protein